MAATSVYLRTLRNLNKLTQTEAAGIVGISSKTVERWEAAKHEPSLTDLLPYVRALKGSAARATYLLTSTEPTIDQAREWAKHDFHHAVPMTDEEQAIISYLEGMSHDRRRAMLRVLRDMLQNELRGLE